jgi:hypothetical protein
MARARMILTEYKTRVFYNFCPDRFLDIVSV